jgi:cytochrome c oxidase subunit 2
LLKGTRRLMAQILSISLLAVLATPGFFVQAENVASPSPRRVEVTAQRYQFTPNVLTLKKGEPVILILKSLDVPHGLRFRELGIEMKVPRGGTAEVHLTPQKTGDFVGHCSVFCGVGHGRMTLTVHVVD